MSDDDETEFVDEQPEQAQPQTIQSVSKSEARDNVRNIIDVMLASRIDPDDIEEMLRDLADGVPYYAEDIEWYSQRNIETQEVENES